MNDTYISISEKELSLFIDDLSNFYQNSVTPVSNEKLSNVSGGATPFNKKAVATSLVLMSLMPYTPNIFAADKIQGNMESISNKSNKSIYEKIKGYFDTSDCKTTLDKLKKLAVPISVIGGGVIVVSGIVVLCMWKMEKAQTPEEILKSFNELVDSEKNNLSPEVLIKAINVAEKRLIFFFKKNNKSDEYIEKNISKPFKTLVKKIQDAKNSGNFDARRREFVSIAQKIIRGVTIYDPTRYAEIVKNLDDKHMWKMVIDGRYHLQGKHICDRGGVINKNLSANAEPGYLAAMLDAFNYMLTTVNNQKLDANLYRDFHTKCLKDVKIESTQDNTNYRNDPETAVRFGVMSTNSTPKGIQELDIKKKSGWECEQKLTAEIREVDGSKRLYGSHFDNAEQAAAFVDEVFKTYYEKLDELETNGFVEGSFIPKDSSKEDKTLEIMLRTCQCLDQAHTFYDGNIRTIAFLVLNKMLMENNMCPVCMYNPNNIDVFDMATLIKTVKESQAAFIKMIES